MRASCQNNHQRAPMVFVPDDLVYGCPICGRTLTPRVIEEAARPWPVSGFIPHMLDYDVHAVAQSSGEVSLEFPRREL